MSPRRNVSDYYVLDSEAHVMPADFQRFIGYYPGSKYFSKPEESPTGKWWNTNPLTGERREKPSDWNVDMLVEDMDKAGIDQACLLRESFLNLSYNGVPCSTNQHTIDAMEKYPGRFIGCSNVGPHLIRGVKNAIGELKILHTEYGFKATKVYSPEDSGPLNTPEMMKFYEICEELGVVVMVHTGLAVGGRSAFCRPMLLDEVCLSFPALIVVAYHFGYPEHETLYCLAWKHKNLYVGMSGLLGPLYHMPMKLRHMVGTAMNMLGSGKLVFGTDWPAAPADWSVDCLLDLDQPEDLQKGYGYPPIKDDDVANMLGLNLAGILGVEPVKKARGKMPG